MTAYLRRLYQPYRRSSGWLALGLLCIIFSSLILTLILGMARVLLSGDKRLQDPDSLTIISISPKSHSGVLPVSPALYDLWSRNARSFEAMAAEVNQTIVLPVKFSPQAVEDQVNVGVVTSNYFSTLGISVTQGRTFRPEAGSQDTVEAVISESLWRREFAGAPDVSTKTVWVNRKPYSIAGVVPDSYPAGVQLWLTRPLEISRILDTSLKMTYYFNVWGRLKHGVTKRQAETELGTMLPEADNGFNEPSDAKVADMGEVLLRRHATTVRLIVLGGFAIFLISCGNASMVLLLRALSRQRDIAVRYMLGATRRRIIALALQESAIVVVAVTALVLCLLPPATRLLLRFLPREMAAAGLPVDVLLILICILVSATCILVPDLATLSVLLRADRGKLLRDDPMAMTAGRESLKTRAFLLAAQLSTTIALSIVALALFKSALVISSQVGLNPHNCIVVKQMLSGERLGDKARQVLYLENVLEHLGRVHGITSAGAADFLPLSDGRYSVAMVVPPSPDNLSSGVITADEVAISGNYFSAIGKTVLHGRKFDWADTSVSEPVVIVDEILARKIAAAGNAEGRTVEVQGIRRKIVGVCAATRFRGFEGGVAPQIYVPLAQSRLVFPFANIVVRVDAVSPAMLRTIQGIVSGGDTSATTRSVEFVDQILDATVHTQTITMYATSMLAGIGFLLSIIGLSAAMAYTVSQRQRDIGIRMALGATAWAIAKTIVQSLLIPVGTGIVLGLVLAGWTARQIASLIYGVHGLDVAICAAVTGIVAVAVACTVIIQLKRVTLTRIPELLRAF